MFGLLIEKGCEYVATLVPPDARGAIDSTNGNRLTQGKQFIWLGKSLSDTFKK